MTDNNIILDRAANLRIGPFLGKTSRQHFLSKPRQVPRTPSIGSLRANRREQF